MAYNSGVSSFFSQTASSSAIFADSIEPTFSFNRSINSLFGSLISPVVKTQSTGSIVNLYGQKVIPTINLASGLISTFTNVNITGPQAVSGRITNAYSLYVNPFSGSGTVVNNFTAYFEGSVGMGTTTPLSALDVAGPMAVGTYAGVISASVSQLVIGGSLGIATVAPAYAVDVNGIAAATQIFSPQTTRKNQSAYLAEGLGKSFSGGNPGTKKTVNTNTCVLFNIETNVSGEFIGSRYFTYDGRYVYMGPNNGGTWGRYDTFLPFSVSTSYQTYNLNTVVNSLTSSAAIGFDGQNVYLQVSPKYFFKYNTLSPFTSSSSYAFFDLSILNTNITFFYGVIFDGTYAYLSGDAPVSALIRYNTNLSFTSSSSYEVFVNPPSSLGVGNNGYNNGTFDGRYIYYVPQTTALAGTLFNFVRYDTFAPFAVSASYVTFNAVSLGGNVPHEMSGVVFTGRYIYYIPFNAVSLPGQIIQYDTTLSFTSASSYKLFNLARFYGNASPQASAFDGRYLYILPWNASLLVRYDTLLPFTASTSYLFSSLSAFAGGSAFSPGVFDGRYIYLGALSNGTILRIGAYPSAQATYLNALAAPQGLTLLDRGGLKLTSAATSGSATGGAASAVPSQVTGYLVVNINGTSRKIPFYNN